jgi:hypothetical protein
MSSMAHDRISRALSAAGQQGRPTDPAKMWDDWLAPEWRNWQTRGTQNPESFQARVGSIPTSGTKYQQLSTVPCVAHSLAFLGAL